MCNPDISTTSCANMANLSPSKAKFPVYKAIPKSTAQVHAAGMTHFAYNSEPSKQKSLTLRSFHSRGTFLFARQKISKMNKFRNQC